METLQAVPRKPEQSSSRAPLAKTQKLHLWVGLIAALFLALAGGTGAILAFREPIDIYLNRGMAKVKPAGQPLPLNEIVRLVSAKYPGYKPMQLNLPEGPDRELDLMLVSDNDNVLALAVNPYTGEVLGDLDKANQFVDKVLRLHKALLLGGGDAGSKLAGFALIALAISGLALWTKRKSLRASRSSSRLIFTLDLHSAIGIYAVAFLFLYAATGVYPRGIGMRRPPRFEEPQHADGPPLQAEELLAAAQKAVPGATPVWLDLQWQKRHGGTAVGFRYPYDVTPIGRTLVHLDPWSGKVLNVVSTQQMSGYRRFALIYDMGIHSGTILGTPTRVIACLSGLVLPVMTVTGPLIWWMRRKKSAG
jgi:uncharacterized iron-regulated membrane protein